MAGNLWAINAVLTSRALLTAGALRALKGVFQLPDSPSTGKGRLALRRCGHAPNAMVLLRLNSGKQKLHVKWWTLATCPYHTGSPVGKWPKCALALHPFSLVSTRRNTKAQAGWKELDTSQDLTQTARGKRLQTAWWGSVEAEPALAHFWCGERPVFPFLSTWPRASSQWVRSLLKCPFSSLAAICTVKWGVTTYTQGSFNPTDSGNWTTVAMAAPGLMWAAQICLGLWWFLQQLLKIRHITSQSAI